MRAGTGAGEPRLDLRQRDRVFHRGLTDVDVERSGSPDLLHPRVFAEASNGFDCSLLERFGLDVHAVTNPAGTNEAHAAGPRRHGTMGARLRRARGTRGT